MQDHQGGVKVAEVSGRARHGGEGAISPVREYVGAMAVELAQMARWDGDDHLGGLLDAAAEAAARSPGG